MKKIIIILLTITCLSCSSEQAGLNELKKLCEKDAGLTIHKTVEADGFYNAYSNSGITNGLIKGLYSFYEFCDESPSTSRNNVFPEAGCFRVKKVKRETGQCDERIDKNYSRFIIEPYPEFLKTYCIEVEKIDKPLARYRYEIERKEWWFNERIGSKMVWSSGRIVDTKTDKIIGESINYTLYPKWFGTGRSHPSLSCGSGKITGSLYSVPFAAGLKEKTLIPKTTTLEKENSND